MGYFRNQEKILLLSHYPQVIKYLCLIYLIAKQDKYDFKGYGNERVIIQNDKFRIKAGIARHYAIWGENICCKKGIHAWTFKIGKWADCYNKIGINPCSKSNGYDGYSLMVTQCLPWQYINNDNDHLMNEKDQKQPKILHKIQNDDVIKMELNCYDWTLSFKFMNNLKEYIKRTKIDPTEYRLKIHLAAECEVYYELLDYSMTY